MAIISRARLSECMSFYWLRPYWSIHWNTVFSLVRCLPWFYWYINRMVFESMLQHNLTWLIFKDVASAKYFNIFYRLNSAAQYLWSSRSVYCLMTREYSKTHDFWLFIAKNHMIILLYKLFCKNSLFLCKLFSKGLSLIHVLSLFFINIIY